MPTRRAGAGAPGRAAGRHQPELAEDPLMAPCGPTWSSSAQQARSWSPRSTGPTSTRCGSGCRRWPPPPARSPSGAAPRRRPRRRPRHGQRTRRRARRDRHRAPRGSTPARERPPTAPSALRGGIYRLATGAQQIDGGLGELSAGSTSCDGLGELQDGANKLATGLADGAEQIPGYGDDADERAGVLANPVGAGQDASATPAATYGVGLLAVLPEPGALGRRDDHYMLLRPVNPRHTLVGGPAWRVALAGLVPGRRDRAGPGDCCSSRWSLRAGAGPGQPGGDPRDLILTAVTFVAIMQFLGAALGPAGRMVALVLLMLQLTSVRRHLPGADRAAASSRRCTRSCR